MAEASTRAQIVISCSIVTVAAIASAAVAIVLCARAKKASLVSGACTNGTLSGCKPGYMIAAMSANEILRANHPIIVHEQNVRM